MFANGGTLYTVVSALDKLDELTRDELIALVRKLNAENERLSKTLDELRRKSHRQATPFSKNRPKADPKRPGRKPGQGRFVNRPAPPELPTDIRRQASMPERCPHCGGGVDLERTETATVTDIPPMPAPVVVRYAVPVCKCRNCGRSVRGQAEGLAADQAGATAHRMGPGVMAMAHFLHYDLGIPTRKVPQVLRELAGIKLTSSAITQDALRQAEGALGQMYQQLRDSMKGFRAVYTDDTGWRIGGKNAYMMAFESDEAVVYQIRYQHRSDEVQEIIPANFAGVMVTDRGKSYDAKVFDGVTQQKCLGHMLHNISDVLESKTGSARSFGERLQELLRRGIEIWKSDLTGEARLKAIQQLDQDLTHALRDRILIDDDNQTLLNGIGLQMDKGRILTFLNHLGVEPTNNRSERIIRPSVIARKVSHCSKNERGAHATEVFLSLFQTIRKKLPFIQSIAALLPGAISANPPPILQPTR
jgi:transposase